MAERTASLERVDRIRNDIPTIAIGTLNNGLAALGLNQSNITTNNIVLANWNDYYRVHRGPDGSKGFFSRLKKKVYVLVDQEWGVFNHKASRPLVDVLETATHEEWHWEAYDRTHQKQEFIANDGTKRTVERSGYLLTVGHHNFFLGFNEATTDKARIFSVERSLEEINSAYPELHDAIKRSDAVDSRQYRHYMVIWDYIAEQLVASGQIADVDNAKKELMKGMVSKDATIILKVSEAYGPDGIKLLGLLGTGQFAWEETLVYMQRFFSPRTSEQDRKYYTESLLGRLLPWQRELVDQLPQIVKLVFQEETAKYIQQPTLPKKTRRLWPFR